MSVVELRPERRRGTVLMELAKPYRFTRQQYHRLADVGILQSNERMELLGGRIFPHPPIGPRHAAVVNVIQQTLERQIGERALVRVQSPLAIDDFTEPQPDLMLLKPQADFYRNAHPTPADVLLVVEVASTSADFDRGPKLQQYAAAGINEYWVVDLNRNVLIVHRRPMDSEYGDIIQHLRDATIAPQTFPDATLAVADVLA
jgi:Uma2 family endonuclease